jgi:hypothetical protein
MNNTYINVIYVDGKVLMIMHTDNFAINELFTHLGFAYKIENTLEPFCVGNKTIRPCLAKKLGKVKYKWVAECSDGAFNDESKELYQTKEECYCYMRDAALEKMKWNTEFTHDFDGEDDSIGYEVSFSQNEIKHISYSGTYTYKIIEVPISNESIVL